MTGNSWVIDLRHFLNEDGALAEMSLNLVACRIYPSFVCQYYGR